MAIAASLPLSSPSIGVTTALDVNHFFRSQAFGVSVCTAKAVFKSVPQFSTRRLHSNADRPYQSPYFCLGNGGGGGAGGGGGGSGGGGNDGSGGDEASDKNRAEAILALSKLGRSLDSIPKDFADAIKSGRIPASIVLKYTELEKSPLVSWLFQFRGFKERLLADDLFLAKLAMECGVGVFTKTAAEYERRRENFFKELEIVFADVAMAIIADFMLVYLPAPTVSLRPALVDTAAPFVRFLHACPDNAFQISLPGSSYSLLQRFSSILRNGAKLFAVGAGSSLVGTVATNALIRTKRVVGETSGAEELPVVSTSVAYGVYMAVSSNLRYQVVAGIIEQRLLEPLLHRHKLALSTICFAIRTGNTYLGSLLWVDYARLVGIQKAEE